MTLNKLPAQGLRVGDDGAHLPHFAVNLEHFFKTGLADVLRSGRCVFSPGLIVVPRGVAEAVENNLSRSCSFSSRMCNSTIATRASFSGPSGGNRWCWPRALVLVSTGGDARMPHLALFEMWESVSTAHA